MNWKLCQNKQWYSVSLEHIRKIHDSICQDRLSQTKIGPRKFRVRSRDANTDLDVSKFEYRLKKPSTQFCHTLTRTSRAVAPHNKRNTGMDTPGTPDWPMRLSTHKDPSRGVCFTLASCVAYCLKLKMEETCSIEASVDFQRTTQLFFVMGECILLRM
jgi:hypothetical protein